MEASKVKPVGNDGDTDQAVTVPPLLVGGVKDTGVSLVKVNGSPLYTISDGATSLIVISMVVVPLPPVLLA